MRCARVQVLYDEYASQALPPATMAAVEEHLGQCDACQREYETHDRIASLLRRQSEIAHPGTAYFDSLNARVFAALEEARPVHAAPPPLPARTPLARPLWWLGSAAAAALALMTFLPAPRPVASGASRLLAAARASANAPTWPDMLSRLEAQASFNGPIGPPAPGQTLNKSANTPAAQEGELDQRLAGNLRDQLMTEGPDGPTLRPDTELQAAREAELRVVALRAEANRHTVPPDQLLEQLPLIKPQLIMGRAADLRPGLHALETTLRGQVADPSALEKLPLVRQANLYLQAEDALAAARPDDAYQSFKRVVDLDPKSPLALRASLQMADLLFSEWADFGEALALYRRCADKAGADAFNSGERTRIERQVELLQRYSAEGYTALARVHSVRRSDWREATAALRDLVDLPGAEPLLPETARAIVDRLDSGDKPSSEMIVEIYNLLARRTAAEPTGDVRAYLELYLGNLAMNHFPQPQQAIDHFTLALTAAGPDSVVGRLARTRLGQLEELSLQELVRNRN